MAMSIGEGHSDEEPIGDMNTTPLIDVMLVLLVMFIITIPIQTHAVPIDLPVNSQTPPPKPPIDPVVNKISVTPQGVLTWNGSAIDLVTFRQYLDSTKSMSPEPELHVQPDAQAPYNTVDQILAVIKKAEITKMGFVGNEQYSAFGK
jgi:biopolymer transport protein ExbD